MKVFRLRKDRTFLDKVKVTTKNYAYVRKMKEFYTSVEKNRSTSIGTYEKETFDKKNVAHNNLSARELKIKEIYPKMAKKDIKSLVSSKKELNHSMNTESKFYPNDPKSSKITFLKSDIFNTEQAHSVNKTTSEHLRTESVHEFKYPTTSDWKRLNTEVLFLKEDKHEKKSYLENYSPKKMKITQLTSHYDNPYDMNSLLEKAKKKDDRKTQFKEVSSLFKEKPHPHYHKMKQNLSLMHGQDFYKNNLSYQIENKETKVFNYKVPNMKNITELREKELKSLCANNGLHIYDINIKPNHINNQGDLSFKLRRNIDNKEFEQKIAGIGEYLEKLGANQVKERLLEKEPNQHVYYNRTNKVKNRHVYNYSQQESVKEASNSRILHFHPENNSLLNNYADPHKKVKCL